MTLLSLGLELPPMSQVVAERRRAAAARRHSTLKRSYAAAQFNRLTNDFVTQRTSANAELRRGLRTLRARSRELSRNDDHMKKFLSLMVSNVIGPYGVRLQAQVLNSTGGEADVKLATAVETAFKSWAHKENASASGKLSWVDAQRLYARTLARDGEVLVQLIEAENPYGFALKFIDVDFLDETFNQLLPDGNRILMSVEVNPYGRPVAYWLTPPSYDYLYPEHAGARQRRRVPAEQFIHDFLIFDDEEQTRGVPWAHTAILRLHMLGQYEEAEIIASRVAACKGVYLIPPDDDEDAGITQEEFRAQHTESLEPGTSEELPAGYDVKVVDPNHPNANVAGFQKAILRGIASGLDVDYVSLANDLEGVNYSSIRAGLLETRDVYRGIQAHAIEHFCRIVYLRWLNKAVFMGAVAGVEPRDVARLREPKWQPRGWAWVDPLKDVQATVMAINNGLDSHVDALAEQGEDFRHVMANLKAAKDLAEKYGLNITAGAPIKPSIKAEEGSEDGDPGASQK
jgi:lambda family phage portal protein